ncbi:AIR synthase family protein [Mucilaginibacter sp. FT3.2]|uniref:AIR synthase family protein n=1 Tax=Mucilaginibacter sp. FT3.2 TaxID=2723090 RepID=UPI00160C73D3|nr:AIR synthase family protein [Mucilaginibacter sp. FT3.2]MBB6231178.1 hydrogenase maturation factor [Mucilaginibacter sp. FT3.2]
MPLSGKLSNGGFDQIILPRCGFPREDVKRGPAFGVDVAVITLPGGLGLALTSDPLSLIPSLGLQESAWLSVHLMANDMATTGFAPMFTQMVLNLPPHLSKEDFTTYWNFIHQYCSDIGVAITGGHTGSIEDQNSTIAGGGTMLLTAPVHDILTSPGARAGDAIIVTKQCAISSSAILAMSFPETVKNKLGAEVYNRGCEMFYQTSSLPDGLMAAGKESRYHEVTAMHDVTEGGVLGAVYEMAIASGNGVWVDNDLLPMGHAQQQICDLFNIDARFCIGAGAMVMAVKKEAPPNVIQRLQQNGIEATLIGAFTAKQQGYKLIEQGVEKELPYYNTDPYWAAFFNALKNGWK